MQFIAVKKSSTLSCFVIYVQFNDSADLQKSTEVRRDAKF